MVLQLIMLEKISYLRSALADTSAEDTDVNINDIIDNDDDESNIGLHQV